MSSTATDVAVLDGAPPPTAPTRRARLRFLRGGKTRTGLTHPGVLRPAGRRRTLAAPYDPDAMSDQLLQPPSGDHWFGTTHTGQ